MAMLKSSDGEAAKSMPRWCSARAQASCQRSRSGRVWGSSICARAPGGGAWSRGCLDGRLGASWSCRYSWCWPPSRILLGKVVATRLAGASVQAEQAAAMKTSSWRTSWRGAKVSVACRWFMMRVVACGTIEKS